MVHTCRYVEYHGLDKLYKQYQIDVGKTVIRPVSKKYFYNVWRSCMTSGVVDPDTGIRYRTHVRKNHCRGFAKCTTCETISHDIAMASTHDERMCHMRILAEHHKEV